MGWVTPWGCWWVGGWGAGRTSCHKWVQPWGVSVRRTSICLSWKTLLMLALKAEPENMEVMG